MTEFQVTKLMPQVEGRAYTLKDADIRGIYSDAVEKFVMDNSSMGEKWQSKVIDLLLNPIKTPADDGDLRGSNPYMNAFLSQMGLPLIELQKLRQAYEQNENKTPFRNCYVETGLALITDKQNTFKKNHCLADKLNDDFKKRNIKLGKGRVPNFNQLTFLPDKESGLKFSLDESATAENIPNLENYEWYYEGKSGLFRAFLNGSSYWDAGDDDLEGSYGYGRVVLYDAEGVAQKKLPLISNKITQRINDFRKNK